VTERLRRHYLFRGGVDQSTDTVAAMSGCSCSHRRAYGHHGTTVRPSSIARETAALAGNALTAQRVGNLGMKQEEPVALYLVRELTHGAVLLEHEALLLTVVPDCRSSPGIAHGEAGPSGDRPRTAPFRNTDTGPSALTATRVAVGSSKL
jgi:hypothetical protein